MYGAILGDIIGSPYEFDRGRKTKNFPFFDKGCSFTDDSVMTIAVADALMQAVATATGQHGGATEQTDGATGLRVIDDEAATKDLLIDALQDWGHRYPHAGYGSRFFDWLAQGKRTPYNSLGNGSAMRVAAAGWLFDDLETTRKVARWTAEVTHNHPEGVKGADATASAIWMARNGRSKDAIRDFIVSKIGYDLSRTCDEIRPGYHHVETCMETVPEAITAFLEGDSFEDVIRTAVSLGGDCDTLTCIAGSIAEAFYGVPEALKAECENRIPDDMRDILLMFHNDRRCELLKEAIARFNADRTENNLFTILWLMKNASLWVPCTAVLSDRDQQQFEAMIKDCGDDPEDVEAALADMAGKSVRTMDVIRIDRKSTRLNSSHPTTSRMPSSA